MEEHLGQDPTAKDTWIRGLFMLLFALFYSIAEGIFVIVVIFQFVHTLVTGKASDNLLEFSENLCAYIYETMLFISFNSEERPFPFAPWPSEGSHCIDVAADPTDENAESASPVADQTDEAAEDSRSPAEAAEHRQASQQDVDHSATSPDPGQTMQPDEQPEQPEDDSRDPPSPAQDR